MSGFRDINGHGSYQDGDGNVRTFPSGAGALSRAYALDPRDFGCPWNGVDDDLPGLNTLMASLPTNGIPVDVQLPPGMGYCSDNLRINRAVRFRGRGALSNAIASTSSSPSNVNTIKVSGINFPPLKGVVFDHYFTSSDYPGGAAECSAFHDVYIRGIRAEPSSSADGMAGFLRGYLDTTWDTWANVPSNIQLGSVLVRSGAPVVAVDDYFAEGLSRDTTHLVMFRCTTAGTKGSGEPAAFATAGLAQLGTTISATSGTAVWTVESVPKDLAAGSYVVGQRVFVPGDPTHVFECTVAGSRSATTRSFADWGYPTRTNPNMAGPTWGVQFYDRFALQDASMSGVDLHSISTLVVDDTADFAASGTIRVLVLAGGTTDTYRSITYTGKTSTTFTGCSGAVVGDVLGTRRTVYQDAGLKWKLIHSGGIVNLTSYIELDRCSISGCTGSAIWNQGLLDPIAYPASSGVGGAFNWKYSRLNIVDCGNGIVSNSNNTNGIVQTIFFFFIGNGFSNVDAAAYFNTSDKFGTGAAGITDRAQHTSLFDDLYLQFGPAMAVRNDLFTVTPSGSLSTYRKVHSEDLGSKSWILFPGRATHFTADYRTDSDGELSGDFNNNFAFRIFTTADPVKFIDTKIGVLGNKFACLWWKHSDDSYGFGVNNSKEFSILPDKWWTIGPTSANWWYKQALAFPRASTGVNWLSGTAIAEPNGNNEPVWVTRERLHIGYTDFPFTDPPSISFDEHGLTAGYTVQGSFIFNPAAAVGKPLGHICTATGTPGTWLEVQLPNSYDGVKFKKRILDGVVATASTSATVLTGATYAMSDETCVSFSYEVTMARRTNVTKAGTYRGRATYRRTSAGAPTVVGVEVYETDQETTAGDTVAFNVNSNTIEVKVTAADSDGRNWIGTLSVLEVNAT